VTDLTGVSVLSENASRAGCYRAVVVQCAPIIGECEPEGLPIICDCEPVNGAVIAPACVAYRAATSSGRNREACPRAIISGITVTGFYTYPEHAPQSAAVSSKVHTGTPSAPAGRGALLLPLVPAPPGCPRCPGHPEAHFLLSFPSHLWYLEHMFILTGPCAAVGPVSFPHGLQGPQWTFTPSLIKSLTSSVSGSA
jgi:hypothetical protein